VSLGGAVVIRTEGGRALVARVVGRGSVLQEELHDGGVSLPGGRVQRRPVLVVDGVHVSAPDFQQQGHHFHVTLPRAHVKGCPTL